MDEQETKSLPSEWSYLIDVDGVGIAARSVHVIATADQCADLARRLQVNALTDLNAEIIMCRESGNLIFIQGVVKAHVMQSCVVTMDPIESDIEESFGAWFADDLAPVSLTKVRHEKKSLKVGAELEILEEREDPEPVINGQIDLGELAAQYLVLAIDPYPHNEGVSYEVGIDTVPLHKSSRRPNPFAALKDWKKDKAEE